MASKITAKVTEILIEEGQHVSKDQVMARLDDSNIRAALAQAEAQHAQAEAALTAARIAFADQIEQRILPKLRGVELADSNVPLEKLYTLIANDLKDEELAKALRDSVYDDGTGRTFNWRGVRRTA